MSFIYANINVITQHPLVPIAFVDASKYQRYSGEL